MNVIKMRLSTLVSIVWALVIISTLGLIGLTTAVHADSVVEGFQSETTLQPGLVVALDSSSPKTVKSAPASNSASIYGVVVDPSDAPFTLNSQNTKIFVATSGTYRVLVSTANGSLNPGDYVALSSIDGIAAKATSAQPIILGKAESRFDGKSNVITTSSNAAIGRILVSIAVQKNPLASNESRIPPFFKNVANSLANKTVPVVRIYTALLIFLISVIAAITILWSGVRSSLVSLGRNPLSRHTIFSGMYKVIFTGLGVLAIGLAGVYLLLRI